MTPDYIQPDALLKRVLYLERELNEVRQLVLDFSEKFRQCSICKRVKNTKSDFHENAGNRCRKCKSAQDKSRYRLSKAA